MANFFGRQAIYNAFSEIYGYEFLFRHSTLNAAPRFTGDHATISLLSQLLMASEIRRYTNGKKAFINYTRNLLVDQLPLLLPNTTGVVEILEDVVAESSVVGACQSLAKHNYKLVLDDFVYHKSLEPLLVLADIVKIDFRNTPLSRIRTDLKKIRKYKTRLLAEKIEKSEDFSTALDLGFELFQGNYFAVTEMLPFATTPFSQDRLLSQIEPHQPSNLRLDRIRTSAGALI